MHARRAEPLLQPDVRLLHALPLVFVAARALLPHPPWAAGRPGLAALLEGALRDAHDALATHDRQAEADLGLRTPNWQMFA